MNYFKRKIVEILDKLPYIKGLRKDISDYEKWGLPGHFYNPIPNKTEVNQYEYLKESKVSIDDSGVNLNYNFQMNLLNEFKKYYSELNLPEEKNDINRFYFNNPNYSYSDSIFYYSILRKFKPKNVIEIGSGFSSCVLLDTNEFYFNSQIQCEFIEPFPELLLKLIKPRDSIKLIDKKVQEVDLSVFKKLDVNDILFIDSSHVLKSGSDLNHIFFNILPSLKSGVIIHFHDIFYPFQYPSEWILENNRAWNEIYALRLFLSHNDKFQIISFNTYLESTNHKWFIENMPLCLKNIGGSIWIQKR